LIMMQRRLSTLSLLPLLLLSTIITKDTNAFTSTKISQRLNVGATVKLASSLLLSASDNNNDDYLTTTTQELKNTLLEHIKTLRSIKDRDGDFDINFTWIRSLDFGFGTYYLPGR
jgi:hypothetical protein